MASSSATRSGFSLRTWLFLLPCLALGLWLLFFDSHSILRRISWHRELAALRAENEQMERRIAELEVKLEEGVSDEVVEQIAREQYGMRRSGERVYRVAPAEE